jgi:hypothetical protein
MTILPDFEQQLVDLAARTYGANNQHRQRSSLSRTLRDRACRRSAPPFGSPPYCSERHRQ